MSNTLRSLRGALASLALSSFAFAGDVTWFADFDVAQKEAEKTGKDLFVDFTGSDWCGWCIRLHKEVFDQEAFQKGIVGDYILVALDFPNGEELKAKVPNPERNEELQQLHGIRGFPTILLMTAKGEVYGRTGYQAGGPEKYLEHVGGLRKSGREALMKVGGLIEALEKAPDADKLAAWDKLADLAATQGDDSPFLGRMIDPLKKALELDPKNEHGRKLRALELFFKLERADAGMITAARELDAANEKGLYEKSVRAAFLAVQDEESARAAVADLATFEKSLKFKDSDLGAEVCTYAAILNANHLQDTAAAKAWAERALALGVKNEDQKRVLQDILGD
jgi:thioredoxin-related protein